MGLYFLEVKREAFWNSKHSVPASSMALNSARLLHGTWEQMFVGRIHGAPARGKQALEHCSCFPSLARELCLSQGHPLPPQRRTGGSLPFPRTPRTWWTLRFLQKAPEQGSTSTTPDTRAGETHTKRAAVKATRSPSCL